jgi:hypothetical protein
VVRGAVIGDRAELPFGKVAEAHTGACGDTRTAVFRALPEVASIPRLAEIVLSTCRPRGQEWLARVGAVVAEEIFHTMRMIAAPLTEAHFRATNIPYLADETFLTLRSSLA